MSANERQGRFTASQEREYLIEANAKVDSLRETINLLEEIVARKQDALSYWEKRQARFASMVRLRAKRRNNPLDLA